MASAVESNCLLVGDLGWDVVGLQSPDLRREGRVQVGDVSLVMLGVVKLHDLGRDGGLECLFESKCMW